MSCHHQKASSTPLVYLTFVYKYIYTRTYLSGFWFLFSLFGRQLIFFLVVLVHIGRRCIYYYIQVFRELLYTFKVDHQGQLGKSDSFSEQKTRVSRYSRNVSRVTRLLPLGRISLNDDCYPVLYDDGSHTVVAFTISI